MSYDNEKDRERRLKYQREYYQKHKEKLNAYNREYRKQNLERISMQQKEYHKKHKVHRNKMTREWKRKLRERLAKEIGSQCCVCETIPKIPIYHEVNFKPHSESNPKFILEHKENFVSMCRNCHRTLHHFVNHREKFEGILRD